MDVQKAAQPGGCLGEVQNQECRMNDCRLSEGNFATTCAISDLLFQRVPQNSTGVQDFFRQD